MLSVIKYATGGALLSCLTEFSSDQLRQWDLVNIKAFLGNSDSKLVTAVKRQLIHNKFGIEEGLVGPEYKISFVNSEKKTIEGKIVVNNNEWFAHFPKSKVKPYVEYVLDNFIKLERTFDVGNTAINSSEMILVRWIKRVFNENDREKYIMRDATGADRLSTGSHTLVVTTPTEFTLKMEVTSTKIHISNAIATTPRTQAEFNRIMNDIFTNINDSDIIYHFSHHGKDWNYSPEDRHTPTMPLESLTPDMQQFIKSMCQWNAAYDLWAADTNPQKLPSWRTGVLVHGPSCRGKTASVELLVRELNKHGPRHVNGRLLPHWSVFKLTLTAGITDNELEDLMKTVPPHSIILLEEIDKQLDRIARFTESLIESGTSSPSMNFVTPSSIIGPMSTIPGINNLVIVLAIANSVDFLEWPADNAGTLRDRLINRQRFARVYHFQTEFNPYPDYDL